MESEAAAIIPIIIFSLCFGVSFNLLIVVNSFHHGVRKKCPVDLITFALGLANVILQSSQASINIMALLISFSLLSSTSSISYFYLHIILFDSSVFSICMVALLSAFYCFKIVSFNNEFFMYLKARFPAWLPWLISGSFVVYLLLLLPMIGCNNEDLMSSSNKTLYRILHLQDIGPFVTAYVMVINLMVSIPLLLILFSLGSTLTSLGLHIMTMQDIGRSHWKAHLNAARTMTLLLLLIVSFYVSMVSLSVRIQETVPVWHWICTILYYSFCTLQALTLILGNKKKFAHRIFCRSTASVQS